MREITDTIEIKKILVQILTYVTDFCDKNGLRYYLAFGTLLGAVRHDGFIPWDDDIDIIMPREDYERFISSFSSERYQLAYFNTNKEYFYPFAKVHDSATIMRENTMDKSDFGLYIDVFPMDGVPDGHILHQKVIVFLQRILKTKYTLIERKRSKYKQLFLPFVKIILKPIKSRDIARLINKLSSKYPYARYDTVALLVWGYYFLTFCKSDIEPGTKHIFEGKEFNVPGNCDAFLKKTYGDYMQLPPVEKRMPKHGYHAYYRD